jgi:small-conductance mechanosensitive channel
VEDIQARATLIKTYDGRRVVIPNSDLFTQKVMVNTAFPKRRVKYDIGIGYGDDIDRAKELVLQAVAESDKAMKDPGPEVLVADLASYAVTLRVRFWIEPADQRHYVLALDQVLLNVKKRLTEAGIDLPYPTQQILFHDQTEDIDGNRLRQREGWPAGQSEVPAPRQAANVGSERNGR